MATSSTQETRLSNQSKIYQPFSKSLSSSNSLGSNNFPSQPSPARVHLLLPGPETATQPLMIRFFQSKLHNPSLSEEHHKVISRLISLKVLCNSYCHIHAIRQQSVGCSISTVEYTSPAGPVLTTTKSKVETALSTALQAQFKCAHGSPFLQAPLALLVGPFRTGPAAAAILEGTFQCPLDVDKYT